MNITHKVTLYDSLAPTVMYIYINVLINVYILYVQLSTIIPGSEIAYMVDHWTCMSIIKSVIMVYVCKHSDTELYC